MLSDIPDREQSYSSIQPILAAAAAAYKQACRQTPAGDLEPRYRALTVVESGVQALTYAGALRLVMHLDDTVGLNSTYLLDGEYSSPEDWAGLTIQTALNALEQSLPVLARASDLDDALVPEHVPSDSCAGSRTCRGWEAALRRGSSLADQYRSTVNCLQSIAASIDESISADVSHPPGDALHATMDDYRPSLIDATGMDVGALATVLEQRYDTSYSDLQVHSEQLRSAAIVACERDNWATYYAELYPSLVRRAVATNFETLRAEAKPAAH